MISESSNMRELREDADIVPHSHVAEKLQRIHLLRHTGIAGSTNAPPILGRIPGCADCGVGFFLHEACG
jgi:hypothetical protein